MPSRHNTDPDKPVIVLFRHDLRVADNRALTAAAATGKPVVPAFVLDEESEATRAPGGAKRWWLHKSLEALTAALSALGVPLKLRRGAMGTVAENLVTATHADMVLWNRRYDPAGVEADKAMKAALEEKGIRCESFDGHLVHEPWRITTGSGTHYRVYSPFWRALVDRIDPRDPLPAPKILRRFGKAVDSDHLPYWGLLPKKPDWAGGLRAEWTPGEAGAHERLNAFLDGGGRNYGENRDRPGRAATSRLSPHLSLGEITPFQIWHACRRSDLGVAAGDLEKFRKEVAWREFCWHLLFHNPGLATANFNRDFDAFTWRDDAQSLEAWQAGQTGYPIVDAGMRELWLTGWMHNRVRMIVASFLAKDLMIDWREGERWFWDTLVDADLANNPAGWQWVAGSGADAAPYFRIFNPVLQGQKFDPDGDYVRRFVPELAMLPGRHIHKPWEAPKDVLAGAGVKLGQTYPVAVIDHKRARERALAEYQSIKGTA